MKITKKQLLDLNPCGDGLAFAEYCNFDFAKIYETCSRGDWLIWLLRKTKAITKPQAVNLAVVCAERVLGIYERKHPGDLRPRQAIEAVKEYALNPTEENKSKCKSAYAAAYAAYTDAAYAAADAADAAAAAARTKVLAECATIVRRALKEPRP